MKKSTKIVLNIKTLTALDAAQCVGGIGGGGGGSK